MADLGTRYLGHRLQTPVVVGASPLTDDVRSAEALAEAGAGMLTLRSLVAGPLSLGVEVRRLPGSERHRRQHAMFAGLLDVPRFATDVEEYCEHLAAIRRAVGASVPVVASVYARSPQSWEATCRRVAAAGPAGIELNVYGMYANGHAVPRDPEEVIVAIVRAVRQHVRVPVAVKLLPVGRTLIRFVQRLRDVGADAVVLFNAFHRSDWFRGLEHDARLPGGPADPVVRYFWISRVSAVEGIDVAYSGGVRSVDQVAKATLCGAAAVQVVSLLMHEGPAAVRRLNEDLAAWVASRGQRKLRALQGEVSMRRYRLLDAFELAYTREILLGALPAMHSRERREARSGAHGRGRTGIAASGAEARGPTAG
ncbi:MAG: hypothetical protein D6725_18290 [Planctomycetota bacterium]|nr:MAG: hypothetical protein D6725_18290 [Planctomycetota bacterium]